MRACVHLSNAVATLRDGIAGNGKNVLAPVGLRLPILISC